MREEESSKIDRLDTGFRRLDRVDKPMYLGCFGYEETRSEASSSQLCFVILRFRKFGPYSSKVKTLIKPMVPDASVVQQSLTATTFLIF